MRHARWLTPAAVASWVAAAVLAAQGPPPSQFPTEITAIRHNSGQPVIPYFEGWIPNADGSFDMVFGYFNRNFAQEFAIPAGAENRIEPGTADQGQPTYFLPRRQRYVYRVRVPKDFGKQELVWTITSNGRAEKAFGNLLPAQEITERVVMTNGNFDPGLDDPNKPPALKIAPLQNVAANTAVTLTALVSDDGLPKPRVVAPPPPPKPTTPGAPIAQVNSSGRPRSRGLTVSWMQHGGPAKVTFEPAEPVAVANGQAVATARFAAPGTYKLIANANDGQLSTKIPVTVTVTGPRPSSGQP
jgi:hypothetical protein